MNGVDNDESFSWIGPGCVKKDKRQMKTHYEGFVCEKSKIHIGDHVMVRNDTEHDSEAFDKCYVAKVVDVYDKGNESDDRHRAIVRWYIQINDAHKHFKKYFPLCCKWELVRDDRKNMYDDDIDAETIFGKCRVEDISSSHDFSPKQNYNSNEPIYFARWAFNGKCKEPIKDRDDELERANLSSIARRCLFGTNTKLRTDDGKNQRNEDERITFGKSPIKSFYSPKKLRIRTPNVNYNEDYEDKKNDVIRLTKSASINSDKTTKERKRRLEFNRQDKYQSVGKAFRSDGGTRNRSDEKLSCLEMARKQLHVSALPDRLPCREKEFEEIYSFVESKLNDGSSGCIYVSGVPGTGKTATVFEVMRCMEQNRERGTVKDFRFVALNGLKMTDPHQVYVQLIRELTGNKLSVRCAVDLLSKRFSQTGLRREQVVLLIDELDLLWTRRQDVLYNLFEWPTRRNARLVVVAVANTMNLPERVMTTRVASRAGMTRVTFQPYTHQQLRQIISERLSKLNAFNPDAVQLVARKVGAVSGDARRALDLCRRATEIAELDEDSSATSVGVRHVDKALNEMFSSPKVQAIQHSSIYEQIMLKVLSTEAEVRGVEEMSWEKVYVDSVALCRVENIKPPNTTEALSVCFNLSSCRLIVAEDGRKDVKLRLRLNVNPDDVYFALRQADS